MNSAKDNGLIWKAILCLIFLVFMIGMAISMTLAGRKGSKVVDRDYYSKGLHYNENSLRGDQNKAKWNIHSTLDDEQLRFNLTDASKMPLAGAAVTLTLIESDAAERTLKLTETSAGNYSVPFSTGTRSELRGLLRIAHSRGVMETWVVVLR